MKNPRSTPLLKGTLDLLVLQALSWQPMHGYGIASWLEANSQGTLQVDDSALYQALHRLEARQMVIAAWHLTENKRRARYYTLTERGRDHLSSETEAWRRFSQSVTQILAMEAPASGGS